ncbi:MAG: hypothetical protein HQL43_02560 [Alphaproteobacteria bacterium]|nr:hypothetical protein [Alphaproteobacteria bacterium]
MSDGEKSEEAATQKVLGTTEARFDQKTVKPRVLSDAFLRHLNRWRISKGLLKGGENEQRLS